MWARRLLLATMVAACAMSLPRHVPDSHNAGFNAPAISVSSLR
jgi:hypothetical protein